MAAVRMQLLLSLCLLLGLSACRAEPEEVIVYTSVDQVFSEPILQRFERENGIAVRAVFDTEETKSTGVLNRLLAEAERPQADVFWSGDPVRPFVLIQRGLVEPYRSPSAASIPEAFRASDDTWTGFAARARVLLVNTERLGTLPMPSSVRDLADPRWRGRGAIASPLYGTTTMHVAALFAIWGDAPTREFLEALRTNDVRIASSNGEVKRLVASGEVTFGLTDTDDADQAVKAGAPVAIVYPDQDGDGTLVMPVTVVCIRGGAHPEAAHKLVDFLLSAPVEQDLAMNAAQMPLRADVSTPPGVKRVDQIRALAVDYGRVAAEMERTQPWLREWVGLE